MHDGVYVPVCCQSNATTVETLRDYCMSRDDEIKQLTRELDAVKADKGNVMKSQDQALQELEQTKTATQVCWG